jgi:uncharacterized protein (DUF2147 family)
MRLEYLTTLFALVLMTTGFSQPHSATPAEKICGKWEAAEKNLRVLVYLEGDKFVAKIIWFSPNDGRPMEAWTDKNNPDKTLKERKILGMSVLTGLSYQAKTNSWEDGMIYDAKHGRDWNASAYIDKQGLLKVEGYWHFKFIGKTLTFKRI